MAKPPPTCATNAFQGYENSRKYASSFKDGETLASRRYSVYVYPVSEHNLRGISGIQQYGVGIIALLSVDLHAEMVSAYLSSVEPFARRDRP